MRLFFSLLMLAHMLGKRSVSSLSSSMKLSSDKSSVAVIGGGISGLSFAQAIAKGPFQPTVFDTGRLHPGGRCSSRRPGDCPKQGEEPLPILSSSLYDHAAQILTVNTNDNSSNSGFAQQVSQWKDEGVVKQYPPGSVCNLVKNGSELSIIPLDTSNMYHGVNGMGSIPQAMVKQDQFPVEQDVWVSPSNGVKYLKSKRQWKVKGYEETFDYLVIAHNGKCADRLMSKTPAKALHSLLRVNFSPTVPSHGGKRMTLNSIYSLTICLKSPSALSRALPSPLVCGFVNPENSKKLRLVSCQSRKYPRDDDDIEVWNILSSAKFGKKYKAPQENLPDELVDTVTNELLASVEELLGVKESLVQNSVIERRLQLWGAAVPLNTYQGGDGFAWDAKFGAGVCGDWLVEPSVAGAWESGQRLATFMLKDGQKSSGLPSVEKPPVFQASTMALKDGIGALPTKPADTASVS